MGKAYNNEKPHGFGSLWRWTVREPFNSFNAARLSTGMLVLKALLRRPRTGWLWLPKYPGHRDSLWPVPPPSELPDSMVVVPRSDNPSSFDSQKPDPFAARFKLHLTHGLAD